ncbi:MAG TPA: ImmA/IrrE family metallo-endopeptidase [Rhizomicrobium sp.]|jgi:Zn-dependent peptidase ImmA (M78 family)
MDELTIALQARAFVADCGHVALPVSVDAYAAKIDGVIKSDTLGENEDAWSFRDPKGKYRICVNCAHNTRRQRFSACHEIAHVVLDIPADHSSPSWKYSRRPPGEVACDVFAAELLLPYRLFKPRVDTAEIRFVAISRLAEEFDASLISTGSRFATFSREMCAFVLSEEGEVRYSARSPQLRDAKGWIKAGMSLPDDSYSARLRAGEEASGPEDAEATEWFVDWERDGALQEDAIHIAQWDQTLTLLWFDDDDLPPLRADRARWEEDTQGLRELDGVLPWPGRKRRK